MFFAKFETSSIPIDRQFIRIFHRLLLNCFLSRNIKKKTFTPRPIARGVYYNIS